MNIILKLLILFLPIISFSNEKYFSEILRDRMKVVEAMKVLSEGNFTNFQDIIATGVSNEEFLFQIGTINKKLKIANLDLVFPDITFVEKYIEKTSENVENVRIYLIDGEIKEKYLENRDFESYLKSDIENKIKDKRNVSIFRIKIDDEDIKKIFSNSLFKKVLEDEIVQKYILN